MEELCKDIKEALPQQLDSEHSVRKVEQSLQTSVAALQDQQSDDQCLLLLKSGVMYLLLLECMPVDLKNNILSLVLECLVAANGQGKKCSNYMMSSITTQCIDIVLSDHFAFLSKMEVLSKMNLVFECAELAEKEKFVQMDSCVAKLKRLFQLIFDVGDYEFQVCIMEFLFRLLPRKLRQKYCPDFVEDPEVLQALLAVKDSCFEVDSRKFLNHVNRTGPEEDRKVFSFPCHKITFGSVELQKPGDEGYADFWLDVNLGSNRLVIFSENANLFSQSSMAEDCWDTLSVWKRDVHKFVCREEGGLLHTRIDITPSASCVPSNIDFNDQPVLHIVTDPKYNLEAVLAKLFDQKKASDVTEPIRFMTGNASQEDSEGLDEGDEYAHEKSAETSDGGKPVGSKSTKASESVLESDPDIPVKKSVRVSTPASSMVSSYSQETRWMKASVPKDIMVTPSSTVSARSCASGTRENIRRTNKMKTPVVNVSKPTKNTTKITPAKVSTRMAAPTNKHLRMTTPAATKARTATQPEKGIIMTTTAKYSKAKAASAVKKSRISDKTTFIPPAVPHSGGTAEELQPNTGQREENEEIVDSPPDIVIPDSLPFASQVGKPTEHENTRKRQKRVKDGDKANTAAEVTKVISSSWNTGTTESSKIQNSQFSDRLSESQVLKKSQGRALCRSQLNGAPSQSSCGDHLHPAQKPSNKAPNTTHPPGNVSRCDKPCVSSADSVVGSGEVEIPSSFEEFKDPKGKKTITGQARKAVSNRGSSKQDTQGSQTCKKSKKLQTKSAKKAVHEKNVKGDKKDDNDIKNNADSVLSTTKRLNENDMLVKSVLDSNDNVQIFRYKKNELSDKNDKSNDGMSSERRTIVSSESSYQSDSRQSFGVSSSVHKTRILSEYSSSKLKNKRTGGQKAENRRNVESARPSSDDSEIVSSSQKRTQENFECGKTSSVKEMNKAVASSFQKKTKTSPQLTLNEARDECDADKRSKKSRNIDRIVANKHLKEDSATGDFQSDHSMNGGSIVENSSTSAHALSSFKKPSIDFREVQAYRLEIEVAAAPQCAEPRRRKNSCESSNKRVTTGERSGVSRKKTQPCLDGRDASGDENEKDLAIIVPPKEETKRTDGENNTGHHSDLHTEKWQESDEDCSDQAVLMSYGSGDDDTTGFRFDLDAANEMPEKESPRQSPAKHRTPTDRKVQRTKGSALSQRQRAAASTHTMTCSGDAGFRQQSMDNISLFSSVQQQDVSVQNKERIVSVQKSLTKDKGKLTDRENVRSAQNKREITSASPWSRSSNCKALQGQTDQRVTGPPSRTLRKRQPKSYKETESPQASPEADDYHSELHKQTISKSVISDKKLLFSKSEERRSCSERRFFQKTFTMSISSIQAKASYNHPATDPYTFDEERDSCERNLASHNRSIKTKPHKSRPTDSKLRNQNMLLPLGNRSFLRDKNEDSTKLKNQNSSVPSRSTVFCWDEDEDNDADAEGSQESDRKKSNNFLTLNSPTPHPNLWLTDPNQKKTSHKQLHSHLTSSIQGECGQGDNPPVSSCPPEHGPVHTSRGKKQNSSRTPMAKNMLKSKAKSKPGLEDSFSYSNTESPNVKSDHGTEVSKQRSVISMSPAYRTFSMPSLHRPSDRGSHSGSVRANSREGQWSVLSAKIASRKSDIAEDIISVTTPRTWTIDSYQAEGAAKSSIKTKAVDMCTGHSWSSETILEDVLDKWEASPMFSQPSLHQDLAIDSPVAQCDGMDGNLKEAQTGRKEKKARGKPSDVLKRGLSDEMCKRKRKSQLPAPHPSKKVTKKAGSLSQTGKSVVATSLTFSDADTEEETQPGTDPEVIQPMTGITSLLQGFSLDLQKQRKERQNQVQELAKGAVKSSCQHVNNLWTTWRAKQGEVLGSFKECVQSELNDLEQDVAMLTNLEKTLEATVLKQMNVLQEQRQKLQSRVKSVMECHEDFRMETEQVEDGRYEAQRGLEVQMKKDMDQLKTTLLLDMQQQQLRRVKDSMQKYFF